MKKILFAMFLACAALSVQAQDIREYLGCKGLLNGKTAVELVYSNDINKDEDNEWMNKISVRFMADDKEVESLSFVEDLNGSVNSEQEEKLEWIIEQDINFDGIPDLLVYIGMSTRAQSLYKAFVWNPVTRQFYEVEAFQEIQEPEFDAKAKTITSYVRDVDGLYIETYKWKNGKLKQVASKKVTNP